MGSAASAGTSQAFPSATNLLGSNLYFDQRLLDRVGAVEGELLHRAARDLPLHGGVGVALDGDDRALVLARQAGHLLQGGRDVGVVEGVGDDARRSSSCCGS